MLNSLRGRLSEMVNIKEEIKKVREKGEKTDFELYEFINMRLGFTAYDLAKELKWSKEEEQEVRELFKKLKRERVPRCPVCKKKMINAIDSKTKKVSKYLWKNTCGHAKGLILSKG